MANDQRYRPVNKSADWLADERARLRLLMSEGHSKRYVASQLHRSIASVETELRRLRNAVHEPSLHL